MLEQLVINSLTKIKNMNLKSISSENLDKDTAYLLGVYLTDGSITKENKFILQVIDKDFAENTLSCIKKIKTDCNANIWTRDNKTGTWNKQIQYCISVGFTRFKYFFEEQTGKKHHIPYIIWDAPLIIKKWFIAGIMDGDGWISKTKRQNSDKYQYRVGIGGIEEGWIYEFEKLLHQMGVSTCKKELIKKENRIPFVRFSIKTKDFKEKGLFFTIKRKQQRLIDYRDAFRD